MTARTHLTRLTAAAALAAAAAGPAAAGLVPAGVPTPRKEGDNYRWTYAIVLPTNMQLQSGNYFTIYDFAGYLPGNEFAPEGWSLSVANSGKTQPRLQPSDDPDVPNLTWTYNGPDINIGQVGLGNFWAYSTFRNMAEDFFTAETNLFDENRGLVRNSLIDRNITDTYVPTGTPTPPPPPGVPEPATLVLAALGLPVARRLLRK